MPNSSVPKYRRVLAVALIAVAGAVLSAGCQRDGAGSSQQASPPSAGQERSDHVVETTDPSDRSESSGSSDTPETPEAVLAADGADLRACQDADCQVELAVGDVLRPKLEGLPLDTITVAKVGADRVRLTMAGRTGQGMTLEGAGIEISSECVGGRCQDSGKLTITTEIPGKINDIDVRLDQVRDGGAILTFEPEATTGDSGSL